jgi:hypothetical protein
MADLESNNQEPCQHRQMIMAYLLGELNDVEQVRFEDHLIDCDSCMAEVESLEQASSLAVLSGPTGRGSSVRQIGKQVRTAVTIAAALALGIFLGVLVPRPISSGKPAVVAQLTAAKSTPLSGTLEMMPKPWGTEMMIKLSNLPSHGTMSITVANANGKIQTIGTWKATGSRTITLTAPTYLSPKQIAWIGIYGTGAKLLNSWSAS